VTAWRSLRSHFGSRVLPSNPLFLMASNVCPEELDLGAPGSLPVPIMASQYKLSEWSLRQQSHYPTVLITLLSGWTEMHTRSFKSAARSIIIKNPPLAGALHVRSKLDVSVEPGKHKNMILEIGGPVDFPM